MSYLLMTEDGEIKDVIDAELPQAITHVREVLPKHTKVWFDGDIDQAFAEYYVAEQIAQEERRPNPIGQRPPPSKGAEWDGPDDKMPEAAMQAASMGRIRHADVVAMSEEEAYDRLRRYFVSDLPPGYQNKKAFASWTLMTRSLMGANYKTAKAAGSGESKPISEKARMAQERRTAESLVKRQAQLDEEFAVKLRVWEQENRERAARGLRPLKAIKPKVATKQKAAEKKPVKLYDPRTRAYDLAPQASSKGLQLLPYSAVSTHARNNGPFRRTRGLDGDRAVLNVYGRALGLCIGSTPSCRASCLVSTGQNEAVEWNKIIKGIRTEAMLREPVAFMKALHVAIDKHYAATQAAGQLCFVRLNIYSDIPWELVYPEIFSEHREVQFYDYTKVAGRDISQIPNYHLTFSYGGTEASWKRMWREFHQRGRQIAIVFNLPRGETFEGMEIDGHPIWDGDLHDIRTWEPSPAVIGLRFKLPKAKVPEAEKVLATDTSAQRKAKEMMAKERRRDTKRDYEQDHFLVQMKKDPSTGLYVCAPVPRLLGAEDYLEVPPPGSDVDPLFAELIPEDWDPANDAEVEDAVADLGGEAEAIGNDGSYYLFLRAFSRSEARLLTGRPGRASVAAMTRSAPLFQCRLCLREEPGVLLESARHGFRQLPPGWFSAVSAGGAGLIVCGEACAARYAGEIAGN